MFSSSPILSVLPFSSLHISPFLRNELCLDNAPVHTRAALFLILYSSIANFLLSSLPSSPPPHIYLHYTLLSPSIHHFICASVCPSFILTSMFPSLYSSAFSISYHRGRETASICSVNGYSAPSKNVDVLKTFDLVQFNTRRQTRQAGRWRRRQTTSKVMR